MHILCPHCKNPVEVVDLKAAAGELSCTACGSSFRVAQPSTTGWSGPVGETLDRFEILEPVGTGAFGTVYKARDPKLDRVVAVKVPRRDNVGPREQDRDRFLREARSAAQLRHPSIVAVHEVGTAGDVTFLVSDFVDGVTLADRLTAGRPPAREAAEIVAAVAEALAYAHAQGVVHRDLKPSNIMIRPDGTPVVMDFGLAKRDAGEITMTMEGQVLGTPAYMSPEQARGEGHKVDGRSDVYSLGVVLYQLLTGELPFRGNTRMLLHQVLHDEPKSPRTLNDRLPRDLETVCLKAVAKEPGRRYQSAGELAADLRRFMAGQPVLARPVGRPERVWRWARRNPAVTALSGTLAILLIATTVGAITAALGFRDQADRERNLTADAQQSAAAATAAGEVATRAATESRTRLAHQYVANAERQITDGNLLGSLPWLVEALKLEQGDPDREYVHRVRLGCVLRACPKLLYSWPHEHQIADVRFAPDPRYILAQSHTEPGTVAGVPAGADQVYLWDTSTGRRCPVPRSESEIPLAAAFHPAGDRLAVLGSDRRLRLFEWPGGRLVGGPWDMPGTRNTGRVVFSWDGQYVSSGCGEVQVIEVGNGRSVGRIIPGQVIGFRFGDRELLLGDGSVREWETGREVFRPPGGKGWYHGPEFSADGRRLVVNATRNDRSDIRVYDVNTRRQIGGVFGQYTWLSLDVRFGRAGELIASSGEDGDAWVWDVATGNPVCPPLRHDGPVDGVRFAGNGRHLLTCSADQTARVWDVRTGLPVSPVLRHDQRVFAGDFGPGGRRVVTGGYQGGQVRLWEWPKGGELRIPLPLTGRPDDRMAVCESGGRLAHWRPGVGLRVWDLRTGRPVGPPFDVGQRVEQLRFFSGGRGLWVSEPPEWGGIIKLHLARVWDPMTSQPLTPPIPITTGREEYSPGYVGADGVWLLRETRNREGYRYEVVNPGSGRSAGPAFSHTRKVFHGEFSPDGARIVTLHGFADFKQTEVWDVATGRQVCPPLLHDYGVRAAAFRPDGRLLVTASTDKTARVWEVATGRAVTPPMKHRYFTGAAAFGADGRFVATADQRNDKSIVHATVWDATTGELIMPPAPLPHGTPEVALDVAGQRLVVLDGTGAIRAWSLEPVRHSLAELEELAAALAQARLDAHGTLIRLPSDHFSGVETRLRSAWPEYFTPSADDAAWHRAQASDAIAAAEWFAADWHLSRLIDGNQATGHDWLRRGRVRATQGRYKEAADDYQKGTAFGEAVPNDWRGLASVQTALGLWADARQSYAAAIAAKSTDPWDWYRLALLQASATDPTDWQRTCAAQQERFRQETDPEIVYCLAMTASIRADPAADLGLLRERMGQVSARVPKRVRYLEGLGYVQWRCGDHAGAVKTMTTALQEAGDSSAADAWIWLVLAMAEYRLDHPEEARRWLARSTEWLKAPERTSLTWDQRRHLDLLHEEATRLLGAPPAKKGD